MQHSEIRVQVTRGGITESEHRVNAAIVTSDGNVIDSWGDIETAVYPRSAIKGLQAIAFVERGGPAKFNFTKAELALCCASHNGEPEHVNAAESMLKKLNLAEANYECGHHWPMYAEAAYELARGQAKPDQRHNNCSGKHAGMLGLANLLEVSAQGYIQQDHPVQLAIRTTMSEICDVDMTDAPVSPDGCSAPTWAIPLKNLAYGFARFADPTGLSPERSTACHQLYDAVVENPFMVAGTERYCTRMMNILGKRAFIKVGAEGVYIAAIPELKLAIAMKCEDGAVRAVERVMTALLERLGLFEDLDDSELEKLKQPIIKNWNGFETGSITCEVAE